MRIVPISNNNQTSFQAINQKYDQWAEREAKGVWGFGELFFQLKMDVHCKNIHPQDGIDTLEAIKKILPNPRTDIDRAIEYVKKHLDLMKQ